MGSLVVIDWAEPDKPFDTYRTAVVKAIPSDRYVGVSVGDLVVVPFDSCTSVLGFLVIECYNIVGILTSGGTK
jgi:hypothetical protein